MAEDSNEILEAYLKRVGALKEERGRAIGSEELRSIARDLGMTEADLARADAAARDYCQRGEGYFRHGHWDEAIAELENAAALLPGDPVTLHALARAHLERWRANGTEADRQAAERLARRSLELDPGHEPSFLLLDALRRRRRPGGPVSVKLAYVAAALLALLIGVGAAVSIFRQTGSTPPPPPPSPAPSGTPITGLRSEVVVPLSLETGAPLQMHVRISRQANYANGSMYRMQVSLENKGLRPIRRLKLQLAARDATGRLFQASEFTALDGSQPPLPPGERRLVQILLPVSGRFHDATLKVLQVD